MIDIQTSRPVFSNATGKSSKNLTPEERNARSQARKDKLKDIYGKAKESGLLTSIENLALQSGSGNTGNTNNTDNFPPPPPPAPENKISVTTWVLIGAGVIVLGVGVYFLTRKKK